MPLVLTQTYTQTRLIPYKWPQFWIVEDFPVAGNQVVPQGGTVAVTQATTANDVQTLNASSATSGTFVITIPGAIQVNTAAIAWNATAAQIVAALNAAVQSLNGCASASWTATGGPINTTNVVLTAAGTILNQPLPLLTINNGNLVGGTVTVTHTTQGVQNGAIVNYNGTLVANPTTAATATATGSDGTWVAGDYTVTYTYVGPGSKIYGTNGESAPAYETSVTISATNHIAIASITGIPAGVASVNVYVNGLFAKNQAVTSNATGAFTITGPASATGATPPPAVDGLFVASDGSQIPCGFSIYAMATALTGLITFGGSTPTGNEYQPPNEFSGNVLIGGYVFVQNLVTNGSTGVDQNTVNTLGRLISGGLTSGVLRVI